MNLKYGYKNQNISKALINNHQRVKNYINFHVFMKLLAQTRLTIILYLEHTFNLVNILSKRVKYYRTCNKFARR